MTGMSGTGAAAGHFENTYECLHCGGVVTVQEDRDESLVLASACPECGAEDAALKRTDRTQTRAVDMDTLPSDREKEMLKLVGETFRWDSQDTVFELREAREATETVEGTEMVYTQMVLDYEDGNTGTISLDDFETHLSIDDFVVVCDD